MSAPESREPRLDGVAIIGMAGRLPGAHSLAEFWRNQLNGVEAISHFRVEELEIPNAAQLAQQPNYVRSRSILDDVDLFDAEFFGIYPREAELMDPQHRIMLESCWQALEDAGYDPAAYSGAIGVYAGMSMSTYFLAKLCATPGFIEQFTGDYQVGNYLAMMGNSLDFLCTRVSYKLNLRGPAFTMQAGCATSLLAVTQACQSLLTYQCDMALAGAVSISFPQKRGYLYQEGGMVSADGHCRTFDADAQGTVFGGGCGVVLLKRLDDALGDGDHIYAVIRGFGVNNDGSAKVGYAAPSVEGQAQVIALAHAASGVDPATIGYVEAHGTATPLGDPIELTALTQAFRAHTAAKQFCVVGSAKTNVGHLDVAAGVTGLIHATHVVRTGKLPPTLHFRKSNPNFDLANSPFRVNTQLSDWNSNGIPRRAGVSAFGVGGTNAHVILQEAPAVQPKRPARPAQVLLLSARSVAALDKTTANLAHFLTDNPETNFADAAWTLQTGRRSFPYRRAVSANNIQDAVRALIKPDPKRVQNRVHSGAAPEIGFLFPGQGSQYPNMGRELYESESVFREAIDRCAAILAPQLGEDLRALLYPADGVSEEARRRVTDTIVAQPAIFSVEYALAQLWMSFGVQPKAMLGHSIGEFVAACLAGVFTLEDALVVVATRGRMMQALPSGGMLSVRLPAEEVSARLAAESELDLAAINGPSLCVVAGPHSALEQFEKKLTAAGIVSRRLVTSHAFHSKLMEPIVAPFTEKLRDIKLNAPRIPYISGVTGIWATAAETTDPGYWARHFRRPVQFSAGVSELLKSPGVLLEIGPGNVLATLARQQKLNAQNTSIVSSLSDGFSGEGDALSLASALGAMWLAGVPLNWAAVHSGEKRLRVSLPTYPFERKRFWLASPEPQISNAVSEYQPPQAAMNNAPETLRTEESSTVSPVPQTPNPSVPRALRLCGMLSDLFQDLSGVSISEKEYAATFLDLGFDSLFLTQVTQALQSKFNIKITFRQLLGDLSTIDALANFLDEKLPSEAVQESAPAPASRPYPSAPAISVPSVLAQAPQTSSLALPSAASSAIEQLLRDQLHAMNQLFTQQLAAVQGNAPIPTVAPPNPADVIPAQPPVQTKNAASAEKPAGDAKELKGYVPFKPLQKGATDELTEQQQKYIRNLIARYTAKTPSSKSKTQQYRGVLADPRVVSGFRVQWKEMVYPIITTKSKGSRLWDIDGNEYIDILNGFGPIMLGHRPEFVQAAIEKQLHEGFEIGPQTILAGEVAAALCEMTGNERATFCNTGSEAVIAAMRVARTVTGRNKIVFFAGDYHGMFDEVLVKGFKKNGEPFSVPSAPGIPREKAANVVVLEYGTDDSLEWIRKNAKDLAAVIVEPVQSRHPNLQPVAFLKELRKITEASDTCFIFDEVVTGFRVHPAGCQALFDIRADLATYGKVLAGGMPIGVLAGKAKYMDALDGGMWQYGDDSYPEVGVTFMAGTFVRHPLAMAACKAVLLHLKQSGPALQEKLTAQTASLVARLNTLLQQDQVPTHVEQFASIFYFSFPPDFRFGSLFFYSLREKGIHVLENFPCFLTTEHTDADIDRIVRSFEQTIAEMQDGGLLPQPQEAASTPELEAETVAVLRSRLTEAPLTESQLEILLAAQLGTEANCSFNESFSLHLNGELNEPILRKSLNTFIARHDALRVTFALDGDKQFFAPVLSLDLPLIDLSHLGATERQKRFDDCIAKDARDPFDLAKGPLVRATLFRFAPLHHVFVFTSHHIVFDGWSTNVFLDELSRLYSADISGAPAQLDSHMSFSDYACDQERHFRGQEGAENEAYWTKQFAQLPPSLNLPIDRPRPALKSFDGATFRKKINAATYKSIQKAGAHQKCTLFVTLLSGFHALLSRLSGQDDIVVGIPAAGQTLIDDRTLVGHCVNFVPLRADLSNDPAMSEFLQQMRQTLLDAYDHQNYTYGRLVRKLAIARDPSRLPLMEVQFNLEKVGAGVQFSGLRAEVDSNPKRFVNFDLFLNVVESKDGLTLDLDYNTALLDESTVARWLDCYESLLMSFAANESEKVSRLSILSPGDRGQLLHAPNQTDADYPRDKCVQQLFEDQAARTPGKVALEFEDQALSYQQLNERSNQLANYLRQQGVQPGDLVGIYMERSAEMIVALLGSWKAGAAYVPLDPTFPRDRLAFVFEDTAVPLILTQARLLPDLPTSDARIVCLDRDSNNIEKESSANLQLDADPSRAAYTIYTSGSTGKPKGVVVTHQNVVNLLNSMAKKPGLTENDVLVAVTTISFDIAALEVYLPLITGAKLVFASRLTASDGRQLLGLLARTNATIMQATPITFRLLLEAGWKGTPKFIALCGGEALSRDLADRILACDVPLWNMYGPTETTIWSATSQVLPGAGPVTVGPPIDNTQFYVLDSNAQPVPMGVPGELYIAGDGVARGYYKRPDLTTERFLPDPFRDSRGARMYRTGDLVRRLPSGDLEFLGRLDGQIKLRGFRIELGEIETALAQHPSVKQAIVVVREDVPGDKRLVAYLLPSAGGIPAAGQLRTFLLTTLPDYMVPAGFITITAVPLTPNGKVDRKALPAPDWANQSRATSYVEPRNATEKQMADIWAEVLRLEKVGINDNLFELGADSLHVFQIVARANKAGLDVKPRQILQFRTISGILAELDKTRGVASQVPVLAPVSRSRYRLVR
jgi:amino acid adenylation domain-containing protein